MQMQTLFEHAGGASAMVKLAEAHYRRCLADPILSVVFGSTPRPEHVQHLADWLGEVFGGPAVYTERHGGHNALLQHHAGFRITETQRRRFVEAFMEAADEAGWPDDEPFRTRIREYVEWGSAIALDVSQTAEVPHSDQPVPRWDW